MPGDHAKQLAGAARQPADEVVCDVAGTEPSAKDSARATVIEALRSVDYGDRIVAVRVNPIDAMWSYRDVVDIVEQAGDFVDTLVLPGVVLPSDVEFVDTLLGMIERRIDLGHTIGIEVQVDTAAGVRHLDDIVVASDRLDAVVFDGVALASAIALPAANAAADHHIDALRQHAVVAARAAALPIVDGPAADDTADGFTTQRDRAAALGMDGHWCTHPRQLPLAAI